MKGEKFIQHVLMSRLPSWETEAHSCWGTLRHSTEHALELSHLRDKKIQFMSSNPRLSLSEGCSWECQLPRTAGLPQEEIPGEALKGRVVDACTGAISMHRNGVHWELMGELPMVYATSINSHLFVPSLNAIAYWRHSSQDDSLGFCNKLETRLI